MTPLFLLKVTQSREKKEAKVTLAHKEVTLKVKEEEVKVEIKVKAESKVTL